MQLVDIGGDPEPLGVGPRSVADAVAREPYMARQVAALSRLKSEVAGSVETADLGIDLPGRRPRAPRRALAIAASSSSGLIGFAT